MGRGQERIMGEYNHNTLYTCMKLSNIKILTFNILDYGIPEGFQVMDYIQNSSNKHFSTS